MARAPVLLGALLAVASLGAAEANPSPHASAPQAPKSETPRLMPSSEAWALSGQRAIRGVTLGPIESSLHPGRGYGTPASRRALEEAKALGANWVSLTVFGRVWDLKSTGVTLDFEQPFAANQRAVATAIQQAHELGLRVLLVPHLWVESGEWRGEIDPPSAEGWQTWTASYRRYLLEWARFAEKHAVDMFAVGVELRSWVTTTYAPSFAELVREVRREYRGLLTYAANWDDVEETVVLGELDLIGVNAFYPLTDKEGATLEELYQGARQVARRVEDLARRWDRPVVFTEFGYTTRPDPALRPWEWPDSMQNVRVDQKAQADAYRALLAALLDCAGFAGLFVWRYYADPADMSQEAEWGFSPRGKQAEHVLRAAFASRWPADPRYGNRVSPAPLLHGPRP